VESSEQDKWKASFRPLQVMGKFGGRVADHLLNQRTPEERLAHWEQALEKAIRTYGPDSRQAAMGRQRVAAELEKLGRYDEARLLQGKWLDAYRLNLGDEHPDTLVAEFNLVLNLGQSGFARDAIPLGLHVFEGRRRIFGPDAKETQSAERLLQIIASVEEG